jgi:hypothetical protein
LSDLVLKDKDGVKQTYVGVTQIKIKNSDGSFETFSKSGGGGAYETYGGEYEVIE